MLSPFILHWPFMPILASIIRASWKSIEARRPDLVARADDDASDLTASILTPRADLTRHRHEPKVPLLRPLEIRPFRAHCRSCRITSSQMAFRASQLDATAAFPIASFHAFQLSASPGRPSFI